MDTVREYYCSLVERAKKDTKEYYQKDKHAWTYNIISAIFPAIVGPFVYIWWGLMTANEFWLTVLAGLFTGVVFFLIWLFGVFVLKLGNAPVSLNNEKEIEIQKHSWSKVLFEFDFYEIENGNIHGWMLKIQNNKDFEITNIAIEIIKIEIARKINDLSKKGTYRLGYIHYDNFYENVKKISEPGITDVIKSKESKEFPITHIVEATLNNPMRPHSFRTYSDEIDWPFIPSKEDGTYGSIEESMNIMAEAMNGTPPPTQPRVIIHVAVKGEIRIGNEVYTLPVKTFRLKVENTGLVEQNNDKDNP